MGAAQCGYQCGYNGTMIYFIYAVSSYKENIRYFCSGTQKPKTNKIKISNKPNQEKPVKLSNKSDAKPM